MQVLSKQHEKVTVVSMDMAGHGGTAGRSTLVLTVRPGPTYKHLDTNNMRLSFKNT